MSKGVLFVFSGPSGSGKDTVLTEVFKRCPELNFSISCITRPMRPGETADGKYCFITREEFERMIDNDELLEHNEFVGNYYGTPKKYVEDHLEAGKDVVVEVDVNGAAQIRSKKPQAVSIFICPSSFSVLKNRLISRGTDTKEAVEKRIMTAKSEIERAGEYDYFVPNDDLQTAIESTVEIIKASRLKVENNADVLNGILNN